MFYSDLYICAQKKIIKKGNEKTVKAFLEEYGLALFVMICIILLILMASPLSTTISGALSSVVSNFKTTTTTLFTKASSSLPSSF